MVQFNEEKQKVNLAKMREREEEDLARILSDKHGVPYLDAASVQTSLEALRVIPEDVARKHNVAAFDLSGKKLSLAARVPDTEEVMALVEELQKKGYVVNLFMSSSRGLESVWEKYKDLSFSVQTRHGSLDISSDEIRSFLDKIHTVKEVRAFIDETLKMSRAARTSRIVEVFVASALALDSSDIHFEPEDKTVRLRFRIDGILIDITNLETETFNLLLSRIKLLSGLKLNVKDKTQDGRFSIDLEKKEIEIRTSILPSEYGESIVLRILDPERTLLTVDDLGMDSGLQKLVEYEIEQPNGLIITTGPTGSGKTTLLYTLLRRIYSPEVKIITIEDPIEYHVEGILQTQVSEKKGYTFASGLRSVLRQDPDVILIGEMRDGETAKTAVNAALTGHLVLSTLHTNNAAGAIPRLLELGVDPKIIPSALRIAMAQRLVRTLCNSCKKRVHLEGAQRILVENVLKTIKEDKVVKRTSNRTHVWEALGCDSCGMSGYKGRVGIFEAITMDEAVEKTIKENPTERALTESIQHQGILNMKQDGVIKVLEGITSLDELVRVVELEN